MSETTDPGEKSRTLYDVVHEAINDAERRVVSEENAVTSDETTYLTFDGMTWPNPDDPTGVEWQLRYGDPKSVRMVAASYVAAYKQMVGDPARVRDRKVAAIRAAAENGREAAS